MRRPVILLPPSKGKASGGSRPAYARTLTRHPLATFRREVLDAAVASASETDDALVARRCGVAQRGAPAARTMLRGLAEAPTVPAHLRYTGVVHSNAGLAMVDPASAAADVRIVSALMGIVALDEPVPPYRLEFSATLPGLGRTNGTGSIAAFWRERLDEELLRIGGGTRVWDLLPAEHARMWPDAVRDELDVVTVRFVRPDGRSANAARTKVAKGRLTAYLLAHPRTTPSGLMRAVERSRSRGSAEDGPLGAGWDVAVEGSELRATYVD
jgi:cytoplasmic iron level regulating protein YaaA (DUF328/UPF0246 family)